MDWSLNRKYVWLKYSAKKIGKHLPGQIKARCVHASSRKRENSSKCLSLSLSLSLFLQKESKNLMIYSTKVTEFSNVNHWISEKKECGKYFKVELLFFLLLSHFLLELSAFTVHVVIHIWVYEEREKRREEVNGTNGNNEDTQSAVSVRCDQLKYRLTSGHTVNGK